MKTVFNWIRNLPPFKSIRAWYLTYRARKLQKKNVELAKKSDPFIY